VVVTTDNAILFVNPVQGSQGVQAQLPGGLIASAQRTYPLPQGARFRPAGVFSKSAFSVLTDSKFGATSSRAESLIGDKMNVAVARDDWTFLHQHRRRWTSMLSRT
jgi:hypothetical protein